MRSVSAGFEIGGDVRATAGGLDVELEAVVSGWMSVMAGAPVVQFEERSRETRAFVQSCVDWSGVVLASPP